MMDAIYTTVMKTIHDRSKRPQRSTRICDVPLDKFNNRLKSSRRFKVFESGNGIYQVQVPDTGVKFITNLSERVCDCKNFYQYQTPCAHAITACRFGAEDPYDYFLEHYTVLAYRATYKHYMVPFSIKDLPLDPDIHPPVIRRQRGRPKTKRIRKGSWKRTARKCGCCQQYGHNRRSCRNQPVQNGRQQRRHDREDLLSDSDDDFDDAVAENEVSEQFDYDIWSYNRIRARSNAAHASMEARKAAERATEAENAVDSDSDLSTVLSTRFAGLDKNWWKNDTGSDATEAVEGDSEVKNTRSRSISHKRVRWN